VVPQLDRAFGQQIAPLLAAKLDDALDATDTVAVVVKPAPKDGETLTIDVPCRDRKAERESITIPNWKARLTAVEIVMKVHGLLREKREISGPGGGPIQLAGLSDDDILHLREIAARVAARAAEPQ